jgi:ubiquitin carboxyl-terminal hydrolase 4/11/15
VDSSGGNKIAANSVDGDDELVDVTMKDSNGVRDSIEIDAEPSEPSQAAKIP